MNEIINEFFTWEMLATLAGASVATGLVTAFVDKLFNSSGKAPTQVIAYVVALAVLLLALAFTGGLTVSSGVLCVFNALIVSSATSGTIAGFKRLIGGKDVV